ncbi:ribonuclease HIII [Spiroplasma endosymbiont of Amphibalanus improvisus]|uniref:ribonuclease HIII n=1 Tax=Spiroplasma endosymbiont of Amphibalanus improvisus TaxID=3066327 RepID=UPI00313DC56C
MDKKMDYYSLNIVGSDEVGVGDVFGPLVVTSSFIEADNIEAIKKLGVKDSKQLTDKKIYEIAPKLMNLVKHKTIIFNNCDYNKIYNQYKNSHILKALGHNKVIWEMLNDYGPKIRAFYIDQFVNEKKYFEYLTDKKNIVTENIFFLTKGESKLASIAISSIISRYLFLESMKALAKQHNLKQLPLGCSNQTKLIAQKYQQNETLYNQIAKEHFNIKIKKN